MHPHYTNTKQNAPTNIQNKSNGTAKKKQAHIVG